MASGVSSIVSTSCLTSAQAHDQPERSEQSEQGQICATVTSNVDNARQIHQVHPIPRADQVQRVHDAHPADSADNRQRIQRSSHESLLFQERTKVICCKIPSELRSRKTPKVMKLNELDEKTAFDELSPQTPTAPFSLDDELACYEASSLHIRQGQDSVLSTSPMDVPLLSLVVNKRRGKSKALIDEYDMVSKPSSRMIIALDDDDQEFNDSWVPDFYVEEEQENRYPLYSDVLRTGLDRDIGRR